MRMLYGISCPISEAEVDEEKAGEEKAGEEQARGEGWLKEGREEGSRSAPPPRLSIRRYSCVHHEVVEDKKELDETPK